MPQHARCHSVMVIAGEEWRWMGSALHFFTAHFHRSPGRVLLFLGTTRLST